MGFTCSRVLRTCLPKCLWFLRTLIFSCALCALIFTCITCLHILTFLRAFSFLYALRVLILLRASRAFIFFFFLRPLHAFSYLGVSSFWCALCAFTFFIKYGATHNQLQQVGINKSEVKQTKNSLNEPKPTPGNIRELFLIKYSFEYFLVTPCCKRYQHSLNLSLQMMLRSFYRSSVLFSIKSN